MKIIIINNTINSCSIFLPFNLTINPFDNINNPATPNIAKKITKILLSKSAALENSITKLNQIKGIEKAIKKIEFANVTI